MSGKASCFERVRHGKEVVRVASVYAAPAEVVGKPRSVRALHQLFQPAEVFAIGLFRRAEIHRNPVLHNFVLFKNLIENLQRPSTVNHEILGDDLKPVDNGLARENMLVMWSAEPDSNSVICKPIKAISRHLLCHSFGEGKRARKILPTLRVGLRLISNYS